MIVSKLIYGCAALAWYQRECDDLEVIQNGFGRWLLTSGYFLVVRAASNWQPGPSRGVHHCL